MSDNVDAPQTEQVKLHTDYHLRASDVARMISALLPGEEVLVRREALSHLHAGKERRKKTGPARERRLKEKNRRSTRAKQRRK